MFVFVFDFFVFLPKLHLIVVKSSPWNRAIQLLIRFFFSYKTFPKIGGFYVCKSLTMFIIAQYLFFSEYFLQAYI